MSGAVGGRGGGSAARPRPSRRSGCSPLPVKPARRDPSAAPLRRGPPTSRIHHTGRPSPRCGAASEPHRRFSLTRDGYSAGVTTRRVGLAVVVSAVVAAPLVFALGPAAASPAGVQPRDDDYTQVVITGRVDVGPEERVGDVVILNGDARIGGEVDGSVFALNGDVRVSGS